MLIDMAPITSPFTSLRGSPSGSHSHPSCKQMRQILHVRNAGVFVDSVKQPELAHGSREPAADEARFDVLARRRAKARDFPDVVADGNTLVAEKGKNLAQQMRARRGQQPDRTEMALRCGIEASR